MLSILPNIDLHSTAQQFPMLSATEEKGLAERLRKRGDKKAAKSLIMAHLRLVLKIAREYKGYGLPQEDLVQEGTIGLMKAVKRFDPSRGTRLAAYAVHWIKAEIFEFVVRNWRIVRAATTKAKRKLFFSLRAAQEKRPLATDSQLATELDTTPKEIDTINNWLSSVDCEFNEALDTPSSYNDPALILEEQEDQALTRGAFTEALKRLDSRTKEIIQQRHMQPGKPATLHELAERYQVSAERVRQLESKGLAKLKKEATQCLQAL